MFSGQMAAFVRCRTPAQCPTTARRAWAGVFVLHIWLDLESGDDTSPVHLFNLSQCLATVTVKDSYYLLSSSADLSRFF